MPTQRLNGKELTGPQLVSGIAIVTDSELPRTNDHSRSRYQQYREIRKDPTVAFARWLMTAPLVRAGWAVECDAKKAPRGAKRMIYDSFDPLRVDVVKSSLENCIDFGWAPFEKVFYVNDGGWQVYKKLKPLITDFTDILIDEGNGSFEGYRQTDLNGYEFDIPPSNCLHINIDTEGTDWYGRSIMEIVKTPYDRYERVETAAERYDTKIAGTHLVVYYPIGTGTIDGVEYPNSEIAMKIIASFKASGAVSVPMSLKPYTDSMSDGDQPSWKIELLSDSGNTTASFGERQKYLDALKVRSFGFPERSVLEGEFGTKAEAEAHASFAIELMELRGEMVMKHINRYGVDQVVAINYGPEAVGSVWLQQNKLTDRQRSLFTQMYTAYLQNPDTGVLEQDNVDWSAIREHLDIPSFTPGSKPLFTTEEIAKIVSEGDESIAQLLATP